MSLVRIETARLRLRPYRPEDLDALHAFFTDPGVRRYLLDDAIVSREWVAAEIRTSMELFASRGFGMWSVFPLGGDALIGCCGYRFFHDPPELQLIYALAPASRNRGLASEGAWAMRRSCFSRRSIKRKTTPCDDEDDGDDVGPAARSPFARI